MNEADLPHFVAQCARATVSNPRGAMRPASIRGMTVQLQGLSLAEAVVWVVTGSPGDVRPSYRISFIRLASQEGPQIMRMATTAVTVDGILSVSDQEVPGNVLDVALSTAQRALLAPDPDAF